MIILGWVKIEEKQRSSLHFKYYFKSGYYLLLSDFLFRIPFSQITFLGHRYKGHVIISLIQFILRMTLLFLPFIPFVSSHSPFPILCSYMEKRKAYNLKWLLAVYNLIQVAVCCHLIFGLLSNEFNIIKFWKCQSVDYNGSQKAITLLTFAYQTFLLKLVELVETVFFVLRKKQNQVSRLHVYHHCSTATLAWILVKYTAGE